MSETDQEDPGRRIAAIRIGVGVAQGLTLYALSELSTRHLWPSTNHPLFAALLAAALMGPVVILGGIGRLRTVTLVVLAVLLAAALGWFAWHGVARDAVDAARGSEPDFPVLLFGAAFVFIVHHLTAPADAARRWIAPYPAYFDTAWKNAVQVALAVAFVAVLWAALALGAQLFKLIGLKAFEDLIGKRWFAIPVTAVAFSLAVQLTDVRLSLIIGIRTVGLVLLSWLLPLMALIAAAFILALPFTSLKPLFATKSATVILLSAAAALIILINAAYQGGDAEKTPRALRIAARLAAACLVPLIAIAAFALFKRVDQYGWTPERIEAAACVLVGAGYALGYAAAAIPLFGPWMKRLEPTNIAMAIGSCAMIFVLFTPIADPARISVNDQVSRLLRGSTAPDSFDFYFLARQSGRYGQAALQRLKALRGGPREALIATLAAAPPKYPGEPPTVPVLPLAQRLTIYPQGAVLPAGFIDQKAAAWLEMGRPDFASFGAEAIKFNIAFGEARCLTQPAERCDAFVVDIDGDGRPEILLAPTTSLPGNAPMTLQIFRQDVAGHWPKTGALTVNCPAAIAAFRAGAVQSVPVQTHDLKVGATTYRTVRDTDEICSKDWPTQLPSHY